MNRRPHSNTVIRLISYGVGLYGVVILYSSLLVPYLERDVLKINETLLSVPLVISLTFIYLSTLLRRRKHTAFWSTILLFMILITVNSIVFVTRLEDHSLHLLNIAWAIGLPVCIVAGLLQTRADFTVKE